MTDIFACNGVDYIVGWSSEKLCDDRELIDVILAREEWFAFQHFCKYAPSAPDIHFDIVLLPGQHDLWRPVVPRRNIAGHLRILDSRQAEIANLEVAILVDQDVAGLKISVHHTSRMHVFQAPLDAISTGPCRSGGWRTRI